MKLNSLRKLKHEDFSNNRPSVRSSYRDVNLILPQLHWNQGDVAHDLGAIGFDVIVHIVISRFVLLARKIIIIIVGFVISRVSSITRDFVGLHDGLPFEEPGQVVQEGEEHDGHGVNVGREIETATKINVVISILFKFINSEIASSLHVRRPK